MAKKGKKGGKSCARRSLLVNGSLIMEEALAGAAVLKGIFLAIRARGR